MKTTENKNEPAVIIKYIAVEKEGSTNEKSKWLYKFLDKSLDQTPKQLKTEWTVKYWSDEPKRKRAITEIFLKEEDAKKRVREIDIEQGYNVFPPECFIKFKNKMKKILKNIICTTKNKTRR
jgi:hypothetical protein